MRLDTGVNVLDGGVAHAQDHEAITALPDAGRGGSLIHPPSQSRPRPSIDANRAAVPPASACNPAKTTEKIAERHVVARRQEGVRQFSCVLCPREERGKGVHAPSAV